MNPTGIAAWVGATTGITSLLWDFFKWKTSGPKLNLSATSGMVLVPDTNKDALYVVATVRNTGTAATTITNMCLVTYDSWLARKRRKSSKQGVVNDPSQAQRIPFKLEPGAQWMGIARQDQKVHNMIESGMCWCEIYHSWSGRPVRALIKPSPEIAASAGSSH